MTLPFFVAYERDSPDLVKIVEAAISVFEAIGDVHIPRQHFGSGPWKSGEFGSFPWYVQQAFNAGRGQAQTEVMWALFEREPYQKLRRHHEIAVLETDLFAEGTNFIYGETKGKVSQDGRILNDTDHRGNPRVTGLIQSTHRMRRRYGDKWARGFFAILVHELGHFYGLASTSNPNYISYSDNEPKSKGPLDPGHCNDRNCIMEQVNIPGRPDLLEKIDYLLRHNGQLFCPPDRAALKKSLRELYS